MLRYIYCILRLGSERGCVYIYVYVCMLRYILCTQTRERARGLTTHCYVRQRRLS